MFVLSRQDAALSSRERLHKREGKVTMRKLVTLNLAGAALALVIPAMAADKPAALRNAWPAETLSGKVDLVEPGQRVLVVEGPDKVPYDIVVTPRTRIKADGRTVALKDLTQYQNKDVTVRFVPEGRGDIARRIDITG
jgi:hypothetical protein